MNNTKPEQWVTVDDVARYLGKRSAWIYMNQKRLGIPRSKLGNHYRYRLSEVERWMMSQ
jgi:excisionase family DNA binding protein